MNKLLIVLLAVCLLSVVSAHTFVKRDAPTADDMATQVKAAADKFAQLAKETIDSVNSEAIKKTINDAVDNVAKTLEKLKQGVAPAAGDDKPAA